MSAIAERRRLLDPALPTGSETRIHCDDCDASLQTRWRLEQDAGWLRERSTTRHSDDGIVLCARCRVAYETEQATLQEAVDE